MHVNSCQGNFFSVLTKSIQVSVGKYQHSLFSEVKPSTWWSTNSFLEGACFFCVWSHFTFLAVDCPAVAKPKSAALLTFIQDLLTSLFRSSLPITRRDRKSPCKLQHKRKKWSKRDFNLQWNIFSLFHRKQGRFNHTLYLFVSRSYLLTSAKFNCKTKISKTAKCQQILRKVLGCFFFFFANDSKKCLAIVSAQKLLDNKESLEDSDLVNAPGEMSQSHLKKKKACFISSGACFVNWRNLLLLRSVMPPPPQKFSL